MAVTRKIDRNELSSERMNFRVKPRVKQAIQQAAALSGVDDSVFTMNAAYRSALETIAAHERTLLAAADHAVFFDLIDNPLPPTERLKDAALRYEASVRTD